MLKSLLERLKRNFDDSKIVSFQFTSKFIGLSFQHVISLVSMV